MSTIAVTHRPLDDSAIDELEKMLSIPLDSIMLKVLDIEHYSDLPTSPPCNNRFLVAMIMLMDIQVSGKFLIYVRHIE